MIRRPPRSTPEPRHSFPTRRSSDLAQADSIQSQANNTEPAESIAFKEFKASCQSRLLPFIRQMETALNLSIAANSFEISPEFFKDVSAYKVERLILQRQLNDLMDKALQKGISEKQLYEWLEKWDLSTLVENRLGAHWPRPPLSFTPFANKASVSSKINLISNYSILLLLKNDIDYIE